MRSRMNHPGRRCRDGFVPWLTSVPVSQEMGLSKRAEMPLLCQPRASGADVRLCAFCFFSYASTLRGLLGTGRISQTNLIFLHFPSGLKDHHFNFLYWISRYHAIPFLCNSLSKLLCVAGKLSLKSENIRGKKPNVALWKNGLFCPHRSNKNNNKTLNLNLNLHSARIWLTVEGVGEIPSKSSVVLPLYINSTVSVPETHASLCFFPRMPCSSPQQLQWAGVLVS